MVGPEAVYFLVVDKELDYLELDFGAAADMRLFLMTWNDGYPLCVGSAVPEGTLILRGFPAGIYFLEVDGLTAGEYSFTIHCFEATPTPIYSPTRTTTPATPTRTPTTTPASRRMFLPLMKRSR